MAKNHWDPREIGYYYSLAQVGLEMVVPAGAGAVIDAYAGTGPWGVITGALLGLAGGMLHLIQLLNRREAESRGQRRDETKPPDDRGQDRS